MGWLCITRREGQRVLIRTPSGELVWVEMGWRRGRGTGLRIQCRPHCVIAREELLPERERYRDSQEG